MTGDPEAATPPIRRSTVWRLAGLAVLLVALAYWAHRHGLYHLANRGALRAWLAARGPWAPVAYVALFLVALIVLVPSTPFVLGAGALFGFWQGLGLALFACMLGAAACFYLARFAGREAIAHRLGGGLARFDAELAESGFAAVLTIRLSNLFPFAFASYAFGLSRVRFRDYLAGTLLGVLPAVAVYVGFGASLVAFKPWLAAIALLLLGALSAISFLWRRRRLARRHAAERAD